MVLVDELPDSVIFESDGFGCSYNSGDHELTCNIGNIGAGDSEEIDINVIVNDGFSGTLLNTATVISNGDDIDPDNNEFTLSTDVVLRTADLEITRTYSSLNGS